jgi:signal transduction histidine kinase/ActR/RegA family two-component response regulator
MSAAAPVTILLVGDQPARLRDCEAVLAPLGERLIKANSADEALARLRACEVAAVLIAMRAPDPDGFRLAARIRAHPPLRETALIFLSAIPVGERDLGCGGALGAVDYVLLPAAPELLRAKVRIFAELHRKARALEARNAALERRVAALAAELADANAELERRVEERTREREAALAQLHEMQKLESIGQLTGGVAHDFNNLLMAVLGNLELIRKYVPDDPRLLRFLDGATQGAERGATLTKRMLAFARRQELRPEAVQIAALVEGMIEMLGRSLGPMIRITTAFAPDLAAARVDPNQLELALLNLAINARDAMPFGGDLAITARRAPAAAAGLADLAAGDYVCLAVRDSGCGMDEATAKRATEPFFTTKGRGRGTGLGLSMVHGLVAQSGGALRIESRPNVGTTVELWLPVAGRAAPGSRPAGAPGAGEILPCRVLVVDDDPIVAAGTAAMIADLGHCALEADSGRRALDLLRARPDIDLVITDDAMPGMTGTELAGRIARLRPGLPVVIASGYAELAGREAALPRLAKPYRQNDLAAMIRALLGRAPPAAAPSARREAAR